MSTWKCIILCLLISNFVLNLPEVDDNFGLLAIKAEEDTYVSTFAPNTPLGECGMLSCSWNSQKAEKYECIILIKFDFSRIPEKLREYWSVLDKKIELQLYCLYDEHFKHGTIKVFYNFYANWSETKMTYEYFSKSFQDFGVFCCCLKAEEVFMGE